ncbi:threonine-phosphate decarboxylase CobD [Microvirga sp. CF3062]|uniref:threonine-phosphate decarboxylase CobD n=1 Tax=Microvirga sp. CF3062 TaxID=3110182 RepID=UPI002E791C4E|nr:threonine-phosphate decarboxylase CobD [Microvirga sp. CF3062]MEE1655135.1 threonine-phosphate decarboxylase CobD [Microvirga sp. CF3062]
MSEARIWHGGDLGEARRLFPQAPEPWIDLSTGINPIAYPVPALPASLFARLPSPADHRNLEEAAAEAYGAKDAAMVVAAPGTQVLISLLPHLRPRSRVAVLGPTYAEHAHSWGKAGHDVAEVPSLDGLDRADVVVVVNPNNPDGRLLKREALLHLAGNLRLHGGWLVVDEAFADFDSGESLVPVLPSNAIVLRSFGKTYGLAGLRIGFALAPEPISTSLRSALGPWAVSGPAIEVGRKALRDQGWLDAARVARTDDACRLDALLRPVADAPLRGTILYRLLEGSRADELFQALGEQGIWVRRFQYNSGQLRFGLPCGEAEWQRLKTVLGRFS